MPRTTSAERTAGYAILATVLLSILAVVGGGVALLLTGRIETDLAVTGEISISGAVPVTLLMLLVLAGLGGLVYVGLSGIFGREDLRQTTENAVDVAEEAKDATDGGGDE